MLHKFISSMLRILGSSTEEMLFWSVLQFFIQSCEYTRALDQLTTYMLFIHMHFMIYFGLFLSLSLKCSSLIDNTPIINVYNADDLYFYTQATGQHFIYSFTYVSQLIYHNMILIHVHEKHFFNYLNSIFTF